LLLLERFLLCPPTDKDASADFAKVRSRFPVEAQILSAEFRHGLIMTDAEVESVARLIQRRWRRGRMLQHPERASQDCERLRQWRAAGGER
jgi:hypothetical protein